MLYKIECEKFKKQPEPFKDGLNSILGDDCATNSIGKSTFLMIIDFAFGGNSYIEKDANVIKEIGHHEIKITFNFEGKFFYFVRGTENIKFIKCCDDKFNCIEEIGIDQYLEFLKQKYGLQDDIGIRNSIGRYSRIYPKENLNEKKPLNVVDSEKAEVAVLSLLKLFDSYKKIVELLKLLKICDEKKKAINNARKVKLIPAINREKYKENKNTIQSIEREIELAKEIIVKQSMDIEALLSSEMLYLRKRKTFLISRINFTRTKIENTVQNSLRKANTDFVDYNELIKFFPNLNIDLIKKVDEFHFGVAGIVSEEVKKYKSRLEEELLVLMDSLEKINGRLNSLLKIDKNSQYALDTFSHLTEKLRQITYENNFYLEKEKADLDYSVAHANYKKSQKEQLDEVKAGINEYLVDLNNYIYSGNRVSPTIDLNEKAYSLKTNNDNGTGIAFKNMVILDVAILNLTLLPCLIHDSPLLKQIQDSAMEKISEIYSSSQKQIFISFDKLNTYTLRTQELLNSTCRLKLSGNGNELFGKSWATKK